MHPLQSDLDHILLHTRNLWEELRGQRVFLTGGTGFFGCWLLETCTHACDRLELDAQVTVLTRDPEGFARKAPHLAKHPAITLLAGDVRTFAFPEGKYAHVIHAATDTDVTLNREQPDTIRTTIIEGTARILSFADFCDAEKCLLASSGAVYGKQPSTTIHMPENEEALMQPLETPSAYAEGKREAERLWREGETNGKTRTIARCFAFVGPYLPLNAHYAIGNFIRDGIAGTPIRVNGDGTPERSYLYAADLVIWLLTILLRGADGRAYNVGSERNLPVREVAESVARCFMPIPPVIIAKEPIPGEIPPRYVPSTERARMELGLQETMSLHEAVQKTIAWHTQKHHS